MISILLVHFNETGYNVLITKNDRKKEIYTWCFTISNLHKVPSKKYIKKLKIIHGLTYVTDKNIIDEGGIILWKREVNYEL